MFRSRSLFQAAATLGVAAPALTSAIQTSRSLARILGHFEVRHNSLSTINSALTKTGGEGFAGATARLARATTLLMTLHSPRATAAALEDIQSVIKTTEKARTVKEKLLYRLALALQLRAANVQLEDKEHVMNVSGATNESEVSTARGAVRRAFEHLVAVAPEDPYVLLGLGEFNLYEGRAEQALENFANAEKLLMALGASNGSSTEDVAGASNCSAAAIVAFKLGTTLPEGKQAKNKVIQDTLSGLAKRPDVSKEDLSLLREELEAAASLSDTELLALCGTLDDAEAGHHFLQFFPQHDEYHLWYSAASTAVAHEVSSFVHGHFVSVDQEELVQLGNQPRSLKFHGSTKELVELLDKKNPTASTTGSSSSRSTLLDTIIGQFGEGPQTSLSQDDVAFWRVMKQLDSEPDCNFSGGSKACVEHQSELIDKLHRQLLYRLQVSRALALDKLGQPQEALSLLDKVVSGGEYTYMWKVFLARGRIRQNLGMVNDADADFRALFKLRKPYAGVDIPLRDENRTKSVF